MTQSREKSRSLILQVRLSQWFIAVQVFRLFNREAFVFYDPKDPGPAVARIRRLQTDAAFYAATMRERVLADGEATLRDYFSLTPDEGGGALGQKIRDAVMLGAGGR